MKLKEMKTGQFFTIGNTRSYPKLRADYGYIDVRDEIKKVCEDLPWELETMTNKEVLEEFKQHGFIELEEITELKRYLREK